MSRNYDQSPQGVLSMHHPLTEKDAIPLEKADQETQEWVRAWDKTYERLGLTTPKAQTNFWYTLGLGKIRYGFSAEDIENMTQKERQCLASIRSTLIRQANRLFGNRGDSPDPHAHSYLGGRKPKIPASQHEEVRQKINELLQAAIPRRKAIEIVAQKYEASPKTVERLYQDHAIKPTGVLCVIPLNSQPRHSRRIRKP